MVQEQGQQVSVWHDIPLYTENGLLNMVVEIPKESSAKMEAATVSLLLVLGDNFPALARCSLALASWCSLLGLRALRWHNGQS